MKRKTGNLRTTMRMRTGVEVLPNGQEHNGEICSASTSELVQWSGQLQTTVEAASARVSRLVTCPNGKTLSGSTTTTLDHLGRDQQRGQNTHTSHTYTLPTHSLTHPYIFTFLCVSQTNTLEALLNLPHHIPGPTLPTINLVDKRSLLIRSC
jgi:hypothetical protein